MKTKTRKYFAAANGYTGFRSYFGEIFDPKNYERIYILKGGPGTGKSNLMKKVCDNFSKNGIYHEEIYCSSDPNSLDGIIIEKNDKKIAVIDGTAPHEADTRFPGAVDELINLGTAWNQETLISERPKIERLAEKKHFHYKNAYSYLKLAGEFYKNLECEIKSLYSSEKHSMNQIFSLIPNKKSGRSLNIRLISSFGKEGYNSLENTFSSSAKKYFVTGIFESQNLFMRELLNDAKEKNLSLTVSPSPFSKDIIEAIYIDDADILISTVFESDDMICTSDFCNHDLVKQKEDMLIYYSAQIDSLLLRAKKEFSKASDCHFALEEIYTPQMNFDKLNKICENLIAAIDGVFIC